MRVCVEGEREREEKTIGCLVQNARLLIVDLLSIAKINLKKRNKKN